MEKRNPGNHQGEVPGDFFVLVFLAKGENRRFVFLQVGRMKHRYFFNRICRTRNNQAVLVEKAAEDDVKVFFIGNHFDELLIVRRDS